MMDKILIFSDCSVKLILKKDQPSSPCSLKTKSISHEKTARLCKKKNIKETGRLLKQRFTSLKDTDWSRVLKNLLEAMRGDKQRTVDMATTNSEQRTTKRTRQKRDVIFEKRVFQR